MHIIKNKTCYPGVIVHAFNLGTWETETGGSLSLRSLLYSKFQASSLKQQVNKTKIWRIMTSHKTHLMSPSCTTCIYNPWLTSVQYCSSKDTIQIVSYNVWTLGLTFYTQKASERHPSYRCQQLTAFYWCIVMHRYICHHLINHSPAKGQRGCFIEVVRFYEFFIVLILLLIWCVRGV